MFLCVRLLRETPVKYVFVFCFFFCNMTKGVYYTLCEHIFLKIQENS